jgi:hypothetical protein
VARPMKLGVDYFSHDTISGKTIFILESSFGNDGYAFWFKLLELLGTQEGLYYDCSKTADWRFLLSKTRVDEDTAVNILNLLASLDAIDSELWSEKIVWSQNYADRLSKVFEKRASETPRKPGFRSENPTEADVSAPKSTQSKVNKSKVKENKEEESICAEHTPAPPPVITLTLNDGTEYPVTQEQVDGWKELYPAVDVMQQLRSMKGWLNANKTKRKTKSGILRFVVNWLSREQDRGRASPQRSGAKPNDFASPVEDYDKLAVDLFAD